MLAASAEKTVEREGGREQSLYRSVLHPSTLWLDGVIKAVLCSRSQLSKIKEVVFVLKTLRKKGGEESNGVFR